MWMSVKGSISSGGSGMQIAFKESALSVMHIVL